jgi:hypothetical protein
VVGAFDVITQLPASVLPIELGVVVGAGEEEAGFMLPLQLHNPSNAAKDIAVRQVPKVFMTCPNLACAISSRYLKTKAGDLSPAFVSRP